MKGLIGKKVGMTQIFDENGAAIPVTVIQAGPCYVTQIRTPEKDGYAAVQLGYEEIKPKRLTGGQRGHLKRHDLPPLRYLREFRVDEVDVNEGDVVTVAVFEVGDKVDVTGTSKGRGFAGAVKRHGFAGGPKTHGQSDRWRATGSRGAATYPGKTWKGSRAPGRMGNRRVTVQGLTVMWVDPERNLIAVKGAVPGPRNGLVLLRASKKK
ncbi:MAG: 50S ribosomal protein L3 [Chloroflexi bacterium]|nr:50S ribosomal protein L3 [Chloroflexota bacterium]